MVLDALALRRSKLSPQSCSSCRMSFALAECCIHWTNIFTLLCGSVASAALTSPICDHIVVPDVRAGKLDTYIYIYIFVGSCVLCRFAESVPALGCLIVPA